MPAVTPQSIATLRGIVVRADGRPAAGAYVIAKQATGPGAPQLGENAASVAKDDGTFEIGVLHIGPYELCAQEATQGDSVNDCEWRLQRPVVGVASRSRATPITLRLESGRRIEVQLIDPENTLSPTNIGVTRKHVVVGVSDEIGRFHPLTVTNRESGGQIHAGIVPVERSLKVQIRGQGLSLTDDQGKRAESVSVDIREAAGPTRRVATLTVRSTP